MSLKEDYLQLTLTIKGTFMLSSLVIKLKRKL
jgi:hypothetical protein